MLKSLFFAAACLLPISALAEPFYVSISGVAANDTLNVRSAPSGSSDDIGDLAHDARGIEITGLDETGKWGRIIWFEGDGWISMRYTAPQDVARIAGSQIPVGLRCGGTEPFWGLDIGATGANYSSMGIEPRELVLHSAQSASGRLGYPELVVLKQGANTAQALIRPAECSDGMSDRTYGYAIDLLLEGGDAGYLSGCCSLSQP